jgi:hypothetical protein
VNRCPAALLEDLDDVLAELRGWPGVAEKSPGLFYVRRQAFLHFHALEGGARRADVRGAADWIEVPLPRPLSATRRRAFLRTLRTCWAER